mmetsp:Transcript_78577/g.225161  ORF Transcript_78577/g.225161 Transcript_78577/m.225161 type:complete len:136 (-) Transcript_78577:20-427(-)
MGKKRSAGAANLEDGGGSAAAGSGAGTGKKRKCKASEERVSLTGLTNEQVQERLKALAEEVRDAANWQEHVRVGTPQGKARFGDAPKDRARTHALYAVQKAEQAYIETQTELEKRGFRTPHDCRLPLGTGRGGLR